MLYECEVDASASPPALHCSNAWSPDWERVKASPIWRALCGRLIAGEEAVAKEVAAEAEERRAIDEDCYARFRDYASESRPVEKAYKLAWDETRWVESYCMRDHPDAPRGEGGALVLTEDCYDRGRVTFVTQCRRMGRRPAQDLDGQP